MIAAEKVYKAHYGKALILPRWNDIKEKYKAREK